MIPLATRHQPPVTSGSQLHAPRSMLRKQSLSDTRPTSLVTGRYPAAFTLIELLVVIAIIVILAGLGFAGLQGALESSKKAQARNDVQQVAAAVKAYLLEYGRLPEESNVIEQLTGENSKEIVFFEAKAAKGSPPAGGISGGKLYDPWGEEYEIELDDDYDNKIDRGGTTHFTTVIVETTPPGDNAKPINNVQ